MKNQKKQRATDLPGRARTLLAVLCLLLVLGSVAYAAETIDPQADLEKKLQNGSFEAGGPWSSTYQQPDQGAVPSWSTTAFQGKIELFRENTGTYIPGVTLKPTAGSIAAELNADEESTLYQNVQTSPSSIYEWGLDHGARNGKDIMALVIGPKQSKNPSKPSKEGRDQFMQMVDWLNIDNSTIKAGAKPQQYTVYSKKFAANGAFEDNAGNNAFSLTPSTIYTEEWHIWIMASSKVTSGTNPWNSYGSNAGGSAGSANGSGSTTVDLSKYYLYTVPAGQTETVFGFVSVGYMDPSTSADKAKTYGNFLDNINFQLYHSLSGSTTTHGSAVIGGSDGTAEGEEGKSGHAVSVDNKLTTYITDGEALKIQAVVKKADAEDGCEFVGLYHTEHGEDGNPKTEFLELAGNDKWIKSTNTDGDIIYTYYLSGVNSATDLHFIFIKSPTVTYDPNGGKPYDVGDHYDIKESAPVKNVYSFKPADNSVNTGEGFIEPFISHAAEGQNNGWKFMGWLLTGDTIPNVPDSITKVNPRYLGKYVLPAEHTVACDYYIAGASNITAAQYFTIYESKVDLPSDPTITWEDEGHKEVSNAQWGNKTDPSPDYANVHRGLTLVAQWRWLQAFIPQVGSATTYTDSANGGTVEISGVTDTDANYNAAYNANGGKSYHAATDETVTVTATAKTGYTFEGWYDEKGNLVTTNTTYTYIETKESVRTLYARFSGSVTQTYIRQVKNGDTWEDTTDDKIGTLGRYTYTDAPGTNASSTATAGTGYKFVGWYDSTGNKVAGSMLINNGTTISYTTTGDATYYARFEAAYTVNFAAQTKQANGSFANNTVGGTVSVASVSDVANATASSKATANSGYRFLGWYDRNGNQLSTNATYSTTTTAATNNVTYFARFEIVYNPTVESRVYLSFVAESAGTQIPSAFDGRDAGTGKNTNDYGLTTGFGNTISTGFKYSLNTMTDVKTIQITVTVPDSAYVKVGGTGKFTGNGTSILSDSGGVTYNKGSIQQISGATTLTYYWDATGLQANTKYGFIIDNLYAPGATATITVNGTGGTKVTSANGVVNTASGNYRSNSHYPE